jgi:Rhodopirellula transposase DDE domain
VYEKGVRVTDEEMEQLDLRAARTLGQWNYVIRPRSKE